MTVPVCPNPECVRSDTHLHTPASSFGDAVCWDNPNPDLTPLIVAPRVPPHPGRVHDYNPDWPAQTDE